MQHLRYHVRVFPSGLIHSMLMPYFSDPEYFKDVLATFAKRNPSSAAIYDGLKAIHGLMTLYIYTRLLH